MKDFKNERRNNINEGVSNEIFHAPKPSHLKKLLI